MKKALTAQKIAAMAAGISLGAELPAPVELLPEEVAAAAEALAAAAALAETEAEAEKLAATDSVTPAPDTLTHYLQAQIVEKDTALTAFSIKVSQLEAKLAEHEATFPALVEIAAKSANNMRVALNSAVLDMSGMAPTLVLAEHAQISEVFQSKFKAGGVAAVDAATLPKDEPVHDPMYAARLASVQPTARK